MTTDANTGGSFNRYAYANNSPYKYIDPDGRDAGVFTQIWESNPWVAPVRMAVESYQQGSYGKAALYAGAAVLPLAGKSAPATAPVASTLKAIANEAKAAPSVAAKIAGPATDTATGSTIGRIIVDPKANAMIEPVAGSTVAAGRGGVDTHTLYPNGSNYQRLNPQGHPNNATPHGHGHQQGTGPGMQGQGSSITPQGAPVPSNSPAAHWPIN